MCLTWWSDSPYVGWGGDWGYTPNLENHISVDLSLSTVALSCWLLPRFSPDICFKVYSLLLSKILLRFRSTTTNNPRPKVCAKRCVHTVLLAICVHASFYMSIFSFYFILFYFIFFGRQAWNFWVKMLQDVLSDCKPWNFVSTVVKFKQYFCLFVITNNHMEVFMATKWPNTVKYLLLLLTIETKVHNESYHCHIQI